MTVKRVPADQADERVWELLYYRAVGAITPKRFVELVNIVEMREPQYAPHGMDGYIAGTFDIIQQGLMDGVLTDAEYEAIAQDKELDVEEMMR